MSKCIFILLYISLILTTPSFSYAASYSKKLELIGHVPSDATVTLYGYTGSSNVVEASAFRVYAKVSADGTGYFSLQDVPILSSTREICLTAIDEMERTSFPTCVPVDTTKDSKIGPILLSPTVSVTSRNDFITPRITLSGQSIPNTTIRLFIAKEADSGFHLANMYSRIAHTFTPVAHATSGTQITIKTVQNGNYSITLPETSRGKFRMYSVGSFEGSLTPKSKTLTLILPIFSKTFLLLTYIITVWSSAVVLTITSLHHKKMVYMKQKP